MSNLAVFFAGALAGSLTTFLSMCFAFCTGKSERKEEDEDME